MTIRLPTQLTTNRETTRLGLEKMKLNKPLIVILTGVLFFALSIPAYASDKYPEIPTVYGTPTPAIEENGDPSDRMPPGDAPDYKNSIAEIQEYINENIHEDLYASLHIDRNESGKEIVVLSFTQEIEASKKNDILALADDPSLIIFRTVDFSEKELFQKQREIDASWKSLAEKGINVYTSSINVFINRVEIGVDPLNEETIAELNQRYGSEMIEVVQGYEVHLLGDAGEEAAPVNKPSLFQRIALFVKSIINGIFK